MSPLPHQPNPVGGAESPHAHTPYTSTKGGTPVAPIKSIATRYDGVEYRSRLEARWAAFFARIGWSANYEPFDGDGYIPDFLIDGQEPLLIEVKPAIGKNEYKAPIAKAENGLRGAWRRDILIVGMTPLPLGMQSPYWDDRDTAGLLGEPGSAFFGEEGTWCWEEGAWGQCPRCHRIGVWHTMQSFSLRPWGCHEGGSGFDSPTALIRSAWSAACNDTKWRGRGA